MKSFFPTVFFFFLSWVTYTQTNIAGKILDSNHQPLEYANTLILNPADSSLVKGNITDETGSFLLENIAAGNYLLSVAMIGYTTYYTKMTITSGLPFYRHPDVYLKEDVESLEEVTITAKRPLYEQKLDRMVVNVKNSVTSTGANALDVLARSPGVRIDGINNEISMNGTNGVIVQINGKRSRMSGDALLQLLQSMPSSNIEKIELINTPPASFDAEGTAGIINIVLVKNMDEGINGSISLNAGYGVRPKFGSGFNMNIRKGKINIYTDISLDNNYLRGDTEISKTIRDAESVIGTETYSKRPAFRALYSGRLGIDYELSKQTTIGILTSAYQNLWDLDASTETNITINQSLAEVSNLRSLEENNWRHWMGNFNLRHTFSDQSKLSFDYDYLNYFNDNPADYFDEVMDSDGQLLRSQAFISRKENPIHFHVAKLDYTHALSEKWKLEMGLKSSMSNFENDNLVADIINGVPINRPLYTNFVEMNENIYAAYMSADWQISEKTSAKLGMRYEYTDLVLEDTERILTERKYGRFFPSAFFSHNFNDNESLQLSYSERIQRPSLDMLAPAFFFFSPNTLIAGNPAIRATFTQQLRLSYRYKTVMFTAQVSDSDRPMIYGQMDIVPEENLTVSRPDNMVDQKGAMLSISFPLNLTEWWEARYELNGIWQHQKPTFEGQVIRQNNLFAWIYSAQTFKLPHNISLEIDGYVQTGYEYGLATGPAQGGFNVGIRKNFDNKSSLTLNWQDAFDLGSFWQSRFYEPELNLVFRQRYEMEGSIFKLTYAWNFGNAKLKKGEQKNGASSDERNRVN